MSEYKIPKLLWENLESVLLAHGKRLVSEYAKILEIPDKELQKCVNIYETIKITLQDTHIESYKCKAYIPIDNVTVFCRTPVMNGSEYCQHHRNKRITIIPDIHQISIQRLKDTDNLCPLWAAGNTLYNSTGNVVGKIKHDKIKIFHIV